MSGMKKIIACSFVLILILSVALSGCGKEPTAEEITANAISALTKIKTCNLTAIVTNTYEVIGGINPMINTATWNSTRLLNVPQKEMQLTMTIDSEYAKSNIHWAIDIYFLGGWEYLHNNLNTIDQWSKTTLTEALWLAESQIPQQVELLRTGTAITLAGNEKVNGINCYVLTITPSPEAAVDWVISQQQRYGPQPNSPLGPALVKTETFKSGSIKAWIAKGSYRLVKSDIIAVFEANPGDTGANEAQFEKIVSTFAGEMKFSNYDVNIKITLPDEALDAREKE